MGLFGPDKAITSLAAAMVRTNEQLLAQNADLHARLMATLNVTAFDIHAAAEMGKVAVGARSGGKRVEYKPPPDTAVEIQTPIDGGVQRDR